jgi:hypothetical protein
VALLDRPQVHESPDAEALFKEARQRRRRRRLTVGTVAILTIAVLFFALSITQGGHGGGHGGGGGAVARPGDTASPGSAVRPIAPTSSAISVPLPGGYRFRQLLAARGRLFIGSYVASKGNLGLHGFTQCALAPVNPKTLKIGQGVRASCDNPAMTGKLVSPVDSITKGTAQEAVAVLNPRTGTYTVGPRVITYSFDSTSSPVFAYGDNWLWVYDAETTAGPQLLQINAVNGHVADAIPTPQLFDPLMVANRDGVWLANSFKGSPDPYVLYHALPGASQLTGTLPGSGLHAYWLTAAGGQVWLGAGSVPTEQILWRFDGVDAAIGLETPIKGSQPFGEVVGDQHDGLWTVVANPPPEPGDTGQPLDVLRINANTGSEQVMARDSSLPALEEEQGLVEGESTVYRGSFYVLEPSSQLSNGYSRLARVTP